MKYILFSVAYCLMIVGASEADSIRIAETHHEDVYIAEADGRYYVYSADGKLLADVSNKRFDVKDVLINREDPDRKAFFKKLRDRQTTTVDTDKDASHDTHSSLVAAEVQQKITEAKRKEYNALMKKADLEDQKRKPLLEKARVEAQKRENELPRQNQTRIEQDKARWAAESQQTPTYTKSEIINHLSIPGELNEVERQACRAYAASNGVSVEQAESWMMEGKRGLSEMDPSSRSQFLDTGQTNRQTNTYSSSPSSGQGKVNYSLVDTMKQQWAAEGYRNKSREEQRQALTLMVMITDNDCKSAADREATLDYIQNTVDRW